MLKVISSFFIGMALLVSSLVFAAAPPVISNNVTVAQHVSPDQCSSSWEGQTSPDIVNVLSGIGEEDANTSPVIRTCSGCAVNSGNCVCQTCYDYFN